MVVDVIVVGMVFMVVVVVGDGHDNVMIMSWQSGHDGGCGVGCGCLVLSCWSL